MRGTWLKGLAGGQMNEAFEGLGRTLSSARADYDHSNSFISLRRYCALFSNSDVYMPYLEF